MAAVKNEALTVSQLVERLQQIVYAGGGDVPVVVACENRADPHPLLALFMSPARTDEATVWVAHVMLHADSGEDFERSYMQFWEEDEA